MEEINKIYTKQELWEIFKSLGEEAFYQNHYTLAEVTEVKDPIAWKKFLLDPEVMDFIDSEAAIMNKAEINKIAKNASSSRSVGQAQLLGALTKLTDTTKRKEGPAFIYMYVPLSEQQSQAENVIQLEKDIFLKETEPEIIEPITIEEPPVVEQAINTNMSILEQLEARKKQQEEGD